MSNHLIPYWGRPVSLTALLFMLGFFVLTDIPGLKAKTAAQTDFEEAGAASAPAEQEDAVESVEFAVLGDFGSGLEQEALVAKMIAEWNVDFIITTGDNYYSAAGGSGLDQLDNSVGAFYCSFLKDTGTPDSGIIDCPADRQSAAGNRFFPSIGNHERTDLQNGLSDYLDYFDLPGAGIANNSGEERYYDFVQGPVHFFVLDSDSALQEADDMVAQKAWLARELARSTSSWQVVTFHHAAYSSARHGSRAAMQWPFAAMGVDAVFQGHDHTYERIHQDGIIYFVSGYGGKSLYDFGAPVAGSMARFNANYGAMKVKATEKSLVFEAWSIADGAMADTTVSAVIVDYFVLGEIPQECEPIPLPAGRQSFPQMPLEECPDDPTALVLNRSLTAVQPAPFFIIVATFLLLATLLLLSSRHNRSSTA